MANKAKKETGKPSFEEAMEELENLVQSMENDSLSLENSLQMFEKGINLTRICQQSLGKVEQEIKILTIDNNEMDFTTIND